MPETNDKQKDQVEIVYSVEEAEKVSKKRIRVVSLFFDRMKHSRFLVVKGIYYLFYSVWMIVVWIGIALVWILSWLLI